jgi:hypothetical protein
LQKINRQSKTGKAGTPPIRIIFYPNRFRGGTLRSRSRTQSIFDKRQTNTWWAKSMKPSLLNNSLRIALFGTVLVLASPVIAVQTVDQHGNVGYDTAEECDAAVASGKAKFYEPFTSHPPLKRDKAHLLTRAQTLPVVLVTSVSVARTIVTASAAH